MYRRFYLILLLISGVVLFAFSILAIVKELNPEWKGYQSEYKKIFIDNAEGPEADVLAKQFDIGHKQIYLKRLKRVDRCMNCHAGVENPFMSEAEVPYRRHSGDYLDKHPVAEFGCTVCHDGQGRATNMKEAHGIEFDTHWDRPVLPFTYIESSCAGCHDAEMLKNNGAIKFAAGEKLFREKGCRGCHKLAGEGGVLGKNLDGIGSRPKHYFSLRYVEGDKTAYAWLREHFVDPAKIVPDSGMKVVLNDEEADLLTVYMLTMKSGEIPKEYRRIMNYPERPVTGEALYRMYCIACHTSGEQTIYDEIFGRTIPAIMNPSFLKSINDRLLTEMIKEGRNGTQMTAWKNDAAGLGDDEIQRIVAYITRNRPEAGPEPFGFTKFSADVRAGRELYKVRCAFCHGETGRGGKGFLGIDLANPVIQGADPEFLAVTVRDGRPGTTMVPFGEKGLKLEAREITDVVAYVRTLSMKE